jgi:RNA polymerase sigma-70 factor (ECF subfamily)
MTDSDATIVRRVLGGDAEAFGVLVDRYHDRCLRIATHVVGDADEAEDAVQEAFVRAHRALHRYEPRETFRAWLFAILVNRCRTAAFRRQRRQRRFVRDDSAMEAAFVDSDAEATEARLELELALDALAPEQREAFLLKHVEQLSYEEMAESTGAGVSALKMRVKRACERLQLLLREVSGVD